MGDRDAARAHLARAAEPAKRLAPARLEHLLAAAYLASSMGKGKDADALVRSAGALLADANSSHPRRRARGVRRTPSRISLHTWCFIRGARAREVRDSDCAFDLYAAIDPAGSPFVRTKRALGLAYVAWKRGHADVALVEARAASPTPVTADSSVNARLPSGCSVTSPSARRAWKLPRERERLPRRSTTRIRSCGSLVRRRSERRYSRAMLRAHLRSLSRSRSSGARRRLLWTTDDGATSTGEPTSRPKPSSASYEVHEWGLIRAQVGDLDKSGVDAVTLGAVPPPVRHNYPMEKPASISTPTRRSTSRARTVTTPDSEIIEAWPIPQARSPGSVTWTDIDVAPVSAHRPRCLARAIPPCAGLPGWIACESNHLDVVRAASAGCVATGLFRIRSLFYRALSTSSSRRCASTRSARRAT